MPKLAALMASVIPSGVADSAATVIDTASLVPTVSDKVISVVDKDSVLVVYAVLALRCAVAKVLTTMLCDPLDAVLLPVAEKAAVWLLETLRLLKSALLFRP